MTDILTRFAMSDGDVFPDPGVGYPGILRGAPFADEAEVEAMMDALHLIADGSLRMTAGKYELDTGPIDFSILYPPELDVDGNEVVPERWKHASPYAVREELQATLGPTVIVEWVQESFFRITTVIEGWDARVSFARGGAAGTSIAPTLRLTEASDATLTPGRVVQTKSSSTQGIQFPSGDWVFEPPDLVNDEGLETAVVLSLFTYALADPDDVLPGLAEDDRQGWWAQPWGSKLWLLSREKWTEAVKQRAEYYTRVALQWLIEDQIADRIEVEARLMEVGMIGVAVAIYRDGRLLFAKPYGLHWQATVSYAPAIARQ